MNVRIDNQVIVKDVSLFINADFNQADENIAKKFPPIKSRQIITDHIYADILPEELCLKIFSACMPKGQSDATLQFGQLYSFIRENAPQSSRYIWDPDEKLQIVLALSRIIHPTTISNKYSARIINDNYEIIPGPVDAFGAHAWVSNNDVRNWLTEIEAKELALLVEAYCRTQLPKRIRQAIWLLEYAFRTEFLDIRWPLICMGFESLIHTDYSHSTKQFSERVAKLAEIIGRCDFCKEKAKDAYNARSSLVHGQLLDNLENDKLRLYEELEDLLREILKKAIMDNSFALIFSSDIDIRTKLPIE